LGDTHTTKEEVMKNVESITIEGYGFVPFGRGEFVCRMAQTKKDLLAEVLDRVYLASGSAPKSAGCTKGFFRSLRKDQLAAILADFDTAANALTSEDQEAIDEIANEIANEVADLWPPTAWHRAKTDACQRGTEGCSVDHVEGSDWSCETW
jgi:hypothetical protein